MLQHRTIPPQPGVPFRDMMDTYQLTAVHLGLPEFLPLVAVVALELGIAYLLRTWGFVPDAAAGHSLGEYAALCAAGVLSPSEALYLVGRRALLMEQHLTPDTHAMPATALAAPDLEARIRRGRRRAVCLVAAWWPASIRRPFRRSARGDCVIFQRWRRGDVVGRDGARCGLSGHGAQDARRRRPSRKECE